MKNRTLAILVAFAVFVSCFVSMMVSPAAVGDGETKSVSAVQPGETLWSFDANNCVPDTSRPAPSNSALANPPAGWELECGAGGAFWGSKNVCSLYYIPSGKVISAKAGGCDGILYFPEIDGDAANFIFEATFKHMEADSSLGLANNITLSTTDSDGDGYYDAGGATWFAIYEQKRGEYGTGYYIRKGIGSSISKKTFDLPEGCTTGVLNSTSTYKIVVLDGVTYFYVNDQLLTTEFTDPNTVAGGKIRVGMYLNNTTVDILSASVKSIRNGTYDEVWSGKTAKPTADVDGDGYIDISYPSELAWVISNGGAADGKWELMNDIWLNDMLVTFSDGVPTVTKRDGTVITDLSTLRPWYEGKTVRGEFKGNGNVVNGLFYDTYSETVSTATRALFPTAGAGLKVNGIGVENAYITSNSSYATAAIVGRVWDVNLTIDSCYAGESVYMYGDNLAGILGGGHAPNTSVVISNCYSLASLNHHDDSPKDNYGTYLVNAIIGNNWSWGKSSVTNCYAVCDTGLVRQGTVGHCTLVSTANASNIKGLAAARVIKDIGDAFVTTEGYPTLKIFLDDINDFENIPLDGGYKKGTGTSADPFIIETPAQLRLCVGTFGESGKYYKLANDICLNENTKVDWNSGTVYDGYEPNVWFGSKTATDGRSYTGFGDKESTFKGYIDGAGYAISGIYYRPYSGYDTAKYGKYSTCAGLVPSFNTGSVSNLVIKNSYISTGRFAGAISADSNAQVLVTNVLVDSTVKVTGVNAGVLNGDGRYGSSALGGFIGYVRNKNNTTFTNCGFAGTVVPGADVGHAWGMVGTHYNTKLTIKDSFSVGYIPIVSVSSGVHGTGRDITVSNLYSNVAVSDSNWQTSYGSVNGKITTVSTVKGQDALSEGGMTNLNKSVWYAVKSDNKAPMLRIYGTRIGDVDENGSYEFVADTGALRNVILNNVAISNGDYNGDGMANICDIINMHIGSVDPDSGVILDDWRSHPEDYKLLAFTFDDGPDDYSPSVTMQVADAFARVNGTATFFFIGKNFNNANDPAIANYVLDGGNEIGNHSYNHYNATAMDDLTDAEFNLEFEGNNNLIKEKTGVTPKYWRGAGYSYSARVYEKLEEIGMYAIGCHTSLGSDWSGGTATVDSIVNVLLGNIPDGAIIGAHSSSGNYVTPDALNIALPILYEQGYRFCTVSDLFEYKKVNKEALPEHAYINRIETLEDGSTKIHTMNRMYLDNWKDNPEDYKLLAFTFDDGPNANDTKFVDLFKKYAGSATFFVAGTQCESFGYNTLQYAINNGWDIGNHSMTHADAHNGKNPSDAAYTELSYEELKYQISDMNDLLASNLTMADGVTPYEVALYRPPQIRTTENVFKICEEENMPVIWLSQNTYDWDSTKDYAARLQNMKNGVGTWVDGDVILGHIWSNDTYNAMVETFDAFYDAGYRFCSITELMEYRGISRDSISGKLNDVDGNQGRVRNIVKSATYGKAED